MKKDHWNTGWIVGVGVAVALIIWGLWRLLEVVEQAVELIR